MNLNELRDAAYKNACEKGFHDKEYSDGHWLCLVNCELAEAVEADRSGKRANMKIFERFQANYVPENKIDEFFCIDYNWYIKGTVEEELADSVIRLLDFAGLRGFNIELGDYSLFAGEENRCDLETFTESIYYIMQIPYKLFYIAEDMPDRLFYKREYGREQQVINMIETLFNFAEYMKIDLLKHIELKMKYNLKRPAMHGKQY